MTATVNTRLAMVLLGSAMLLGAADQPLVVAPKAPLSITASLDPRKEASWTFTVRAGKEARVGLAPGQKGVSLDLFDAENLTPNEGVAAEDWFPVAPGRYRVTATNVTALGAKATGHAVAFEIKIEVR